MSDKKKGDKKGKKEESKKEEPKKDAKKKKTTGSILDSYNLVKSEENIIAKFKLELNGLLDGNLREIVQKYSCKLKEPEAKLSESVLSKKKGESKKGGGGKGSAEKGSKAQKMKVEQNIDVLPVEQAPMELALKFELIDFNNFDELKNYFSQKIISISNQSQQNV